jgi:hypothetical protein
MGVMRIKAYAALVCLSAVALGAIAVEPAAAQTTNKRYYTKTVRGAPGRPRRIVVAPRSFLDAGTEVLPGERKFTDYALPPAYYPMGVVTNTGGRVGWHQSPLPGPFDLAGPRNPFGW